MAFALLIIGILLLTSAVRNTQADLVALIKYDFSGPGNFTYWVVALIIIGAIGYIEKLKPLSDALLVLILLALFLTRGSPSYPGGGVFKQLTAALQGTQSIGIGGSQFFSPTGQLIIGGGIPNPFGGAPVTPGNILFPIKP